MDTTKLRLLAAVGGASFGFAGIVALAIAAIIALEPILGPAISTATIAAILLCVACICLYVFLQPQKSATEEVEDFEAATADALADLPFDTIQSMIEKHPLKVATVAVIAGYTLVKDPGSATKQIERLMLTLM